MGYPSQHLHDKRETVEQEGGENAGLRCKSGWLAKRK